MIVMMITVIIKIIIVIMIIMIKLLVMIRCVCVWGGVINISVTSLRNIPS